MTARYKGIDCLKLVMAYVVVAIHTLESTHWVFWWTAVPFFFIVSGFFLFRKLTGEWREDVRTIGGWTLKGLRLYLVWTAVYLPFTVYGWKLDGLTVVQGLLQFARNLVFVGENYLSWPLWYLLGMVWGGCAFLAFRACRIPRWGVLALTALLSAVPWVMNAWPDSLYWKIFPSWRIFVSFVFLSLGGSLGMVRCNRPAWMDRIFDWLPDAVSVQFRNASATIFLTHMLFAGCLIIFLRMSRGPVLFFLSSLGATLAAVVPMLVRASTRTVKSGQRSTSPERGRSDSH